MMCSRVRYVSENSARKALKSCRRMARRMKRRREQRVYRCDVCKGWHLTSEKVFV